MKQELSKIIKPYLHTEEWGHDELIIKLEKYFKKKVKKRKKTINTDLPDMINND